VENRNNTIKTPKKHEGQQGQQSHQQYGSGNSNSGIRVRTGGAYSAGSVGGQQGQGQQYGSVRTISVVRTTRPSGSYSAGSNVVQGNSAGGHYAIADDSGNFQSTSDSSQAIPVWAIAVIAIASIILVALIVISVQLMLVIRNF